MNSLRRKAIAVIVLALALIFTPVAANAYTPTPPDNGERTEAPGATFRAMFSGFQAGERVTFNLSGPNAGDATYPATAVADAAGNVTIEVTLPASSEDGDVYSLVATGDDSGAATLTINVAAADAGDGGTGAPGTPGGTAALPQTGAAASSVVLVLGAVMLGLGGAIVLFARRQAKNA